LPSTDRIFEDPTRIQGVRDYQAGDSLRRMDWKTSARVGSLQVRRYEPAIAQDTAIFLNLDGRDYEQTRRAQGAELGIVVAASEAVHVAEKRQAVALVTNGVDPLGDSGSGSQDQGAGTVPSLPLRKGREHLMHILDLLARVEQTPKNAVPFVHLLSRKSLALPWGSTVVVVTSRETAGMLDRLLALRRRGLAVILVLTVADRDFEPSARRAGQIGVETLRIWDERGMDVWR
jgi:uncharacterized protein (DUF58 family)